jgi:hypothetical protein
MAAVQSLLKPVFALVGWTFAMEGWMYATRLPAMSKYKIKTDPNFSKEKLNNQIPPHVRWKGKSLSYPTLEGSHTKQSWQPTITTISTKRLRDSTQWRWDWLCMLVLRLLH